MASIVPRQPPALEVADRETARHRRPSRPSSLKSSGEVDLAVVDPATAATGEWQVRQAHGVRPARPPPPMGVGGRSSSACLASWRHPPGTRFRSPPAPAPEASAQSIGSADLGPSQPLQPGRGEQGRVDLSGRKLGQPGIDIAPERHDLEVRPHPPSCAARRGETCRRPRLAASSHRLAPISRSRTSPRGRTAAMPRSAARFDVLHRMDREIGFPGQQREVELLGPQRLAADFRQGPVLDLVAGRLDRPDLDMPPASRALLRGGGDLARLGQRQRRSARSDVKRRSVIVTALAQGGAFRQRLAQMALILGPRILLRRQRRGAGRQRPANPCTGGGRANDAHRPFGGVVPEIAARAHVEILPGLVRQVLHEAESPSARSTRSPRLPDPA